MLARGNLEAHKRFLRKERATLHGTMLELGCGAGNLTAWISTQGFVCFGADRSLDRVRSARAQYGNCFIVMDAQHLAIKDCSINIVMSFDLLEHLPDISCHLQEVRRVLKPSGSYLLQTPNRYTSTAASVVLNRSFTRHLKSHCSLQSKQSLTTMLGRSGFIPRFVDVPVATRFFKQKVERMFGSWIAALSGIIDLLPVRTNYYVVARLR